LGCALDSLKASALALYAQYGMIFSHAEFTELLPSALEKIASKDLGEPAKDRFKLLTARLMCHHIRE